MANSQSWRSVKTLTVQSSVTLEPPTGGAQCSGVGDVRDHLVSQTLDTGDVCMAQVWVVTFVSLVLLSVVFGAAGNRPLRPLRVLRKRIFLASSNDDADSKFTERVKRAPNSPSWSSCSMREAREVDVQIHFLTVSDLGARSWPNFWTVSARLSHKVDFDNGGGSASCWIVWLGRELHLVGRPVWLRCDPQ